MARRKQEMVEYTRDGVTRERKKRTSTYGYVETLPSGKFRVRYLIDGRRYSSAAFDDRREAERYRAALEAERRAGTLKPPASIEATNFKEYAHTWVEQHRTSKGKALAPRTKAENLRMLEHGLSYFDPYSLTLIDAPLIRKWHAKRCNDAGATTAGNEARVLKAILQTAVNDGVLEKNPVPGELTRSKTGKEHRAPTTGELKRILDHLEGQWRVAVLIAAFGGLRAGELSALERRDIEVRNGRVVIHVTKQAQWLDGEWIVKPPKSVDGVRFVTLPEWIAPDVETHLRRNVSQFPNCRVFVPSRGAKYVSTATLGRVLHKAMADAGIDAPIHWHDLRHYFGTELAKNGVGIRELQAALGHGTPAASLSYLEQEHGLTAALADRLPRLEDSSMVAFPRKEVA
ncbi:site-specific integrase [Bifidobacterium longum]|uniref:tyrosine-type recombinase/integrase n=1 Tax=Bifidobacterium longum TaxID=216816 RepID=UPI001F29C10B|nr:site-specific integrase [Bifidobacterium longum]UIP49305.1 site-specific integrase [Bifidobacterium longum]